MQRQTEKTRFTQTDFQSAFNVWSYFLSLSALPPHSPSTMPVSRSFRKVFEPFTIPEIKHIFEGVWPLSILPPALPFKILLQPVSKFHIFSNNPQRAKKIHRFLFFAIFPGYFRTKMKRFLV